jgi:hypothetical protein
MVEEMQTWVLQDEMNSKSLHSQKLKLYGIPLNKAKFHEGSRQALDDVQYAIERVMRDSRYLENAPFPWVTIAIQYGSQNSHEPSYQSINKAYGGLLLVMEIDARELKNPSHEELGRIFEEAALRALICAGRRFSRPVERLELMLSCNRAGTCLDNLAIKLV